MWLLAGGHGQLGQSVTKALNRRGIVVVALSSSELDVNNLSNTKNLIAYYKPKVVLNAAAYTDVDGAESNQSISWRINAEGPKNLANASKLCGAIFSHVSTNYVFSGFSEAPYLENDSPSPINFYGESKAVGERNVSEVYPENSYIFRTAWLYSSFRQNFAKTLTRKALARDEANVVNDQFGQPTFAGDVAERIVSTILKKLPVGIYHVTNSGSASWYEYAQEIYKLANVETYFVKPVSSTAYPNFAQRPLYSVLSDQKLTDLGLNPMREWRIALKEVMPAIISAVQEEG